MRKKREKEQQRGGGMKLLELADGLQPRILGFCDYHRNPKPQACRKRKQHVLAAAPRGVRERKDGQRQTEEVHAKAMAESVGAGGLTGAGDERGRPTLHEPGWLNGSGGEGLGLWSSATHGG